MAAYAGEQGSMAASSRLSRTINHRSAKPMTFRAYGAINATTSGS
jgi:hypothetical protein